MRRIASLTVLLALAGCLGELDNGSPTIPDGTPVYRIVPNQLMYSFRDTTNGVDLTLNWITTPPTTPFVGTNCLGMLPDGPGDTTGTFIFAWIGLNTGFIRRDNEGVTDTTTGYFFPPQGGEQGTRGSYVVNSAGTLTLDWADGLQSRYFQPAAQMTFSGDTIVSVVDVHTRGDSIREQWRVVWAFDGLNGC